MIDLTHTVGVTSDQFAQVHYEHNDRLIQVWYPMPEKAYCSGSLWIFRGLDGNSPTFNTAFDRASGQWGPWDEETQEWGDTQGNPHGNDIVSLAVEREDLLPSEAAARYGLNPDGHDAHANGLNGSAATIADLNCADTVGTADAAELVAPGAEDFQISYTIFPGTSAQSKKDVNDEQWSAFVARIKEPTTFPSKSACPLVSLSEFGTQRTPTWTDGEGKPHGNSLRHADNVLRCSGGEFDYDNKAFVGTPAISFDEAITLLQAVNVRAMLYTTPSYNPDAPRWRVLLPFSEACLPQLRAEYVARANRILKGLGARESFTLSQTFYVGRVEGVEYRTAETFGRFIDQCSDIEPLFFNGDRDAKTGEARRKSNEELCEDLRQGRDRHPACISLSSRWAAKGMAAEDIAEALNDLLGPNSRNADGVDFNKRAYSMYAVSAVKQFGDNGAKRTRPISTVIPRSEESAQAYDAALDAATTAPKSAPEVLSAVPPIDNLHRVTRANPQLATGAVIDQDGEILNPPASTATREQRIDQLARIDEFEYDAIRAAVAREMGCQVKTLDNAVGEKRKEIQTAKEAHDRALRNTMRQGQLAEKDGFNDTDRANGVRLVTRHGKDLSYTEATGWLVWDERRWAIDATAVVVQARAKDTAVAIFEEVATAQNRQEIFDHAKRSESKKGIEGMIYMARSEPGITRKFADFDANTWLLNVNNGTLDLKAGALHPHDRANLITKLVPIDYDPNAKCERWIAFLEQSTGANVKDDPETKKKGEELCAYLKRLAGYFLTGQVTEHVLVFLHGKGRNGKSVFSEIMRWLLGEYAIAARPEMIMARKNGDKDIPNDVAALRGVRLCIMNETSAGQSFNEQKMKDMTGGDTLEGEFKYKEKFNFEPTHKLMIRGNHKPKITGRDPATWERLHLVPFTRRPPTLNINLKTEIWSAESSGILRWAVEGCIEWQNGGLKAPAHVLEAVEEYKRDCDSLGQFIADHCLKKTTGSYKSGDFFKTYKQYCLDNDKTWLGSAELKEEMLSLGFGFKEKNTGNFFTGIEFAPYTPKDAETKKHHSDTEKAEPETEY